MKALILLAGLSVGLNHPVFAQGRGAVRENARDWKAAKKEYQAAAEALYLQQLYVQKLEKEALASKGQNTTLSNQLADTEKQLDEVNKKLALAQQRADKKNIKYYLSQQERLTKDKARLENLASSSSAGVTGDPLTEAKKKLAILAQAEEKARNNLNKEAKQIHSLVTGNEKKGINRALDLRAEVSEGGTQDWALKRLQLEAKNAATDQHHKIYDEWESVGEIKVPVVTSSTVGPVKTPDVVSNSSFDANMAQDEAAAKLRESSKEQFAAYEEACKKHRGFARAKSVTTTISGITTTTQSYAVCNDGTKIPYDLPGQDPNHKTTPAQNTKTDCDLAYAEVVKLLADGNSSAFADMVTLVDLKMAYRLQGSWAKSIEDFVNRRSDLQLANQGPTLKSNEFKAKLTDLYQKYGMPADLESKLFKENLFTKGLDSKSPLQNESASAVALYLSVKENTLPFQKNMPQALKFNESDAATLWALKKFEDYAQQNSKVNYQLSQRVKNYVNLPETQIERFSEILEGDIEKALSGAANQVKSNPAYASCFSMCENNGVLKTEFIEKVKAALAKFVVTGKLKDAKEVEHKIDMQKAINTNLKLYLETNPDSKN